MSCTLLAEYNRGELQLGSKQPYLALRSAIWRLQNYLSVCDAQVVLRVPNLAFEDTTLYLTFRVSIPVFFMLNMWVLVGLLELEYCLVHSIPCILIQLLDAVYPNMERCRIVIRYPAQLFKKPSLSLCCYSVAHLFTYGLEARYSFYSKNVMQLRFRITFSLGLNKAMYKKEKHPYWSLGRDKKVVYRLRL